MNYQKEIFKKLFLTYVNLHPSIRERILYKDIFLRIEESIRKKKEINIYYKERLEKINLFHLKEIKILEIIML